MRGPGPSCEVLGRKVVRGHAGQNRIRFSGRVGRRRLAPGIYSITVVAHRGQISRRLGTIGIEVVPPGRPLTAAQRSAPVSLDCDRPSAAYLAALVLPHAGATASHPVAASWAPGRQTKRSGVLGAEIPTRIFPRPPLPDGRLGTALALLILAAIGLALAALIVYVTRFMRGSWNP